VRSFFFFSGRRRHTRWPRDWSSDVCSSDLNDFGCSLGTDDGRVVVIGAQGATEVVAADPKRAWIDHVAISANIIAWSMAKRAFEIGRASCRERVEISVGAV